MYYILTCDTFYYSLFIYFPFNIFVVFVRGKGILVYKHMHHLLSNILVYILRLPSFRARNKSRTAIISIHDQPSILSLWNEVDCYVQPAEEDAHFTFVRLCIDTCLAPINSMLTTFSVPTQYDIYFFHVWQFVLLLLEWGWLLCAASWKISQFHLWYVIVHVVRSVHSGMQRTATSVPTQYYIYLSAALLCFDQASWWVV